MTLNEQFGIDGVSYEQVTKINGVWCKLRVFVGLRPSVTGEAFLDGIRLEGHPLICISQAEPEKEEKPNGK